MKLRVVFRGLILFRFDIPKSKSKPELKAYLVNVPKTGDFHEHEPQIVVTAQSTTPGSPPEPWLSKRLTVTPDTSGSREDVLIKFTPTPAMDGVRREVGYDNHVPNLSTLFPVGRRVDSSKIDPDYVSSTITVPHGTVRAARLVTWEELGLERRGAHGLALVKFINADPKGHLAHECVLEADVNGTDIEIEIKDELHKTVTTHRVQPLKGARMDVEPDTVEILVTNFSHQRVRPLFWSTHFQWLYLAAGFEPPSGSNMDQFRDKYAKFRDTIVEKDREDDGKTPFVYDAESKYTALFDTDANAVNVKTLGFPFPYLPGIRNRRSGVLGSRYVSEVKPLKDPLNRPLCPPACC